ncbi:MAG: 1-acyl-sn-glycerol-3-phosphate acyltransferase [Frankiaceae bacterium]|nr:1-acyl-sn-glycerol-3-phosphate acyltransferase [Frankiaceae bacterium]MBV9869225.1 1-acyl-sn-glycerol-3-phosphate acyltransferase [Frankiaceae bacterium]
MTARSTNPARESVPLWLVRHFAALLIRLYFKVRLRGLEHLPASGPVLLAGNHTGFLDGPIVMITLPRPSSILIKSEIYKGPLPAILNFGRQIPVHRGTPDRTALQAGLAVLRGGGVLGMFPEGTRGSGSVETIQHGIGYLALHGNCPVVPVLCRGTAEALPKGKALPRFRAPIEVVFGPAFTLDVSGDPRARSTIAAAAEEVRLGLLAHVTEQRELEAAP